MQYARPKEVVYIYAAVHCLATEAGLVLCGGNIEELRPFQHFIGGGSLQLTFGFPKIRFNAALCLPYDSLPAGLVRLVLLEGGAGPQGASINAMCVLAYPPGSRSVFVCERPLYDLRLFPGGNSPYFASTVMLSLVAVQYPSIANWYLLKYVQFGASRYAATLAEGT